MSRFPGLAALLASALAAPALAADLGPGQQALAELRKGAGEQAVVQNRFFLKAGRFELSPMLGYVPNNPMVKRFTGGVVLAYHFSEQFSMGSQVIYAPDLGESDLKGLTSTLVTIAHGSENSGTTFQQPVDKLVLGATFTANWAPIYGKIDLVGETVLNFDLYGSLGLGMLSIQKAYAEYDKKASAGQDPVSLRPGQRSTSIPVSLGVGTDFFVTQSLAVKLDARSLLYIDKEPQYDPNVPPETSRLYNDFVATFGIAVFFPRMKPRITSF